MEGAISNPPNTRIAVVTGGNKGIGLEVCRQLASAGVTVVLTARDVTRGEAAVEKLRELGLADVVFHQLEITDASSIAGLADFLKARFGKLDILVNNAAIGGAEYVEALDTDEEKFSGLDVDQRLEWMMKSVNETVDAAKDKACNRSPAASAAIFLRRKNSECLLRIRTANGKLYSPIML